MANDLPIRFDIEVRQRATFRERFQIPLDCTNRDVQASVWSVRGRQREKLLLQFEVEWENRAKKVDVPQPDGTTVETIYADFYLVASYEQTALMTVPGVWDLLVIEHNGERTYWMEGVADMNPGHDGSACLMAANRGEGNVVRPSEPQANVIRPGGKRVVKQEPLKETLKEQSGVAAKPIVIGDDASNRIVVVPDQGPPGVAGPPDRQGQRLIGTTCPSLQPFRRAG